MASGQAIWNALARVGLVRPGFVTPYRWLASAPWEVPEYPEVRALFEAARPEFAAHVAAIAAQEARFLAFGEGAPQPSWTSNFLPPLDGAAIYAAVARFRPRRVLEVGSGNSTHFLARAALDHGTGTEITCIDPAPRIDIAGLPVTFERRVLGVADAARADALEAGDILFIDSSHLMQQGFDLDILLNRMLPRLKAGVLVHVHDIYLPYPYPPEWEKARWNEQTALIGWLLGGAFAPVFASHFAVRDMAGALTGLCPRLPQIASLGGGSLWLRRV